MRAVIDTNVMISGLLWRGPSHELLEYARSGALGLISSPALIDEFDEVLRRPKFHGILVRAAIDLDATVAALRRLAEIVDPPPLPARVSRDPDDDAVLALAIATRAEFIVSGDGDLLSLGGYEGIPILTPAIAVAKLRAASSAS